MALLGIPAPAWVATLAARLGFPRLPQMQLSDQVSQVILADSLVTLSATALPPVFGTPASAGELVGPAAGALLADTGQLAAGNWSILALASITTTDSLRLHRRNAANAGDIWANTWRVVGGGSFQPVQFAGRFSVAQNERFTIEAVAGGGGTYYGAIFATLT